MDVSIQGKTFLFLLNILFLSFGFNVPTIKHILKNLPDIHHDFTTLSLFDGYSGCQIALRQLQQEREEQRTTEWVEMYNNNKEIV